MPFAPYARRTFSLRERNAYSQRCGGGKRLAAAPVLFLVIAKSYCDGSFHEPLSIISYRLAHLWPRLQPCMERAHAAASFFPRLAYSLSRFTVSFGISLNSAARSRPEKYYLSFFPKSRTIPLPAAENILTAFSVTFTSML